VLWRRGVTLSHWNNDHLVGGAVHSLLCRLYGSWVVNGDMACQGERSLVNLVILLSHDTLHKGEPMRNVRIEGLLLLPSLDIAVPPYDLWDAAIGLAEILCLIERVSPELVRWCGPRSFRGVTSCTKEGRLVNSLEELFVGGMSWVVRALRDSSTSWWLIRALVLRRETCLALIGVHHLIVSLLEAIRGSHGSLNGGRTLLRGVGGPVHLSNRVIIGHADLSIVLIVFPNE
jgi:hypothetical protein